MNVLGLVFSVLLILSYGYYALLDKHAAGIKLRNAYLSHYEANRKVLNQYESQFYNHALKRAKTQTRSEEMQERQEAGEEINEKEPELNRECARLNLWPLIQEGKEAHPVLYELAAKLILTFYEPLHPEEKRFEYRFLNLLLASAKKSVQDEKKFALEKIVLLDPEMQKIYYKMLRGTKKWDLREKTGYPPFSEYVKAEPSQEKICIFHAHPDLLTVIFNPKMAWKLHTEIHRQDGSPLTRELLERIAGETHIFTIDQKLLDLLQLSGYQNHEDQKKTFIADVGGVSLRKKLSLDNSR
ncbi:MAG: hypothetical protein K1X28_04665 [Parachlamydiales bacterium]|nr:hypothetical protein [Parachlamydiales bacterium]